MAIRYLSGINVDSNTLFVDSTNNRVGIGTDSPSRQLELVGSDAYIQLTRSSASTQATLGFNTGATNDWLIRTGDGSTSNLQFYSYGTSSYVMTIARSSGNVGIGTTSPLSLLHVYGSNPRNLIQDAGAGHPYVQLSNSSGNFYLSIDNSAGTGFGSAYGRYLYSEGAYPMILVTNSAERMRITSGGSVLIATSTNPYTLGSLVVSHDSTLTRTYFQRGVELIEIVPSDGTGPNIISSSYTSSGSAYKPLSLSGRQNNADLYLTTNGNVGIGTTNPGAKLDVNGDAWFTNGGSLNAIITQGAAGKGRLYLYDGGNATIALQTNGASYFNAGNVGIGTTSPAEKLHVYGTGNQIIKIENSGTYLMYLGLVSNEGYIGSSNATPLTFYTNNVSRMYITTGGNVGIGTTSPAAKLHTVGEGIVDIVQSSNTVSYTQYYTSSTGASSTSDGLTVGLNGLDGYVFLREAANLILGTSDTERLRITAAGNVGIGTTSPQDKLTVKGATNYNLNLGLLGGYSGIYVYNDASSAYNHLRIDASPLLLNSYSGGNVGIGTTAPGAKLQVGGASTDVELLRLSVNYDSSRSARGGINWHDTTNTTGRIYTEYDGGSMVSMVFGSLYNGGYNSNDLMIIRGNGNVGIGTANPGERLHVVGPSNNWAAHFVSGTSESYFSYGAGYGAYINAGNSASSSTYILELLSNGSSRMFVRGDGNVGIGTTSPAAVAGYVAETIDGTNGSFTEYRQNGTALFRIGADSSRPFLYGMTNANMDFYTNTAQRMRITNDGNILLGTNQSYTRLTVSNGNNTRTGVTLSDADTSSLMLFAGASTIASINFDTYGLRFMGGSTAGVDNGTEIMRFTTSYNVGIGTTSPATRLHVDAIGHALVVSNDTGNRRIYFGTGTLGEPDIQAALSNGTARELSINAAGGNVGIGVVSPTQELHVSGNVRVTGAYYDSSNSAGSSGQVLSSTGSGTDWVSLSEIAGVDGTGTANYVAKWSDADTIANSQIVDNGTNVGINNATPKTKLDVNGAIGFGSKTLNISDTFVTVLTVNMSNHTGCYVKITAFGDWSGHSAVAYLGEFFLQNGASAYNEPGVIIRQVDNTNTDDVVAQIVDPAGTGTRDFEIQLKTTSASGVPFSAAIQYEVRGQYNSVS